MTCFVAGVQPLVSVRGRAALVSRRPRHAEPTVTARGRHQVRMLGPMPFGGGAFFESPLVRDEAERLEKDHADLVELGKSYGKFDRDGKLRYVAALEDIMDRWLIMLKRFELSDSFQCRMYVTHMKSELSKHGLTIDTLTANSRESLNQMRREAEREMPSF